MQICRLTPAEHLIIGHKIYYGEAISHKILAYVHFEAMGIVFLELVRYYMQICRLTPAEHLIIGHKSFYGEAISHKILAYTYVEAMGIVSLELLR